MFIPILPLCVIRSLSTGVAKPFGVVLNRRFPGISSSPGVSSTFDIISAPLVNVSPSQPLKVICPKLSPF